MTMADPATLSASEALARIASGALSAEHYVGACLDRIDALEPTIAAWVALDRDRAMAAARQADRAPSRGLLHGMPIGIKDIMATASLPTACGSPIYRGTKPPYDAALVALARRAGAIILGKTVTTEFAYMTPGPTRNPRDPARTPGGSSSGSAAAVAAGMVPLATGTQTAGSIIRPAAFCGVVGFKPSYGLIETSGVKRLAGSLDTMGILARTVEDAALFVDAVADLPLVTAARGKAPPRRIGFCRSPAWDTASDDLQRGFEALRHRISAVGVAVNDVTLPAEATALLTTQHRIMNYEAARALAFEIEAHWEALSPKLREQLSEGRAIPRHVYEADLAARERFAGALDAIFAETDLLLTPSAAGIAPLIGEGTGDPLFNRLWTLAGTPCVNVPGLADPAGLPLGVQIVGPVGGDATAIAGAAWLESLLAEGI
jgi:Asp-tRNA(Asn)/Glu-tRNA(Gln) amidotransferase A subunit family amidase